LTTLQKALLFAILPALIAGAFSIAPKVYDVVVEPTASLTYRLAAGPELGAPDGYRKILSVVISNTGKKPLSEIKASLDLPQGRIERHRVVETSGLAPAVEAGDQSVTVSFPVLHPGENLTLAAMVLLPQPAVEPKFLLRSREILGTAATDPPMGRDTKLDLVGAVLAAASVFLMSLLFMLRLRGGALPFGSGSKQDALFYIAGRLGLTPISDEMRLADAQLTFLRMADILLSHGLHSQGSEREKAILGLKALLLVRDMAGVSKEIVITNLKTLEGSFFAEEIVAALRAKAVNMDEVLELRRRIDALISNETVFLTAKSLGLDKG